MRDTTRFAATGSAYDLPEPSFDADLALVGRGTKCGELLRRYWHPVHLSSKLADLPVEVVALNETIILFRKPNGEAGAVYPRCVHRGTSLLWGKVTDIGIRCCYHGWTFETDGRCTAQPQEPDNGGKGRNAVRQPWYPVEERYGLIFVYLGPLDKKPALPRYDILENVPDGWELVADDTTIPSAGAGYMPCNWLQHHENGMDPHHVPILHEHQFPPMMAQAESTYAFFKDADRVRGNGISKIGPMMMDFKVELIIPTVRIIPSPLLDPQRPDGKSESVGWTLPKTDTDTMVFTVLTQPVGHPPSGGDLYDGKLWTELTPDEHQRFPGDFEAQTGQGAITFHSEEHLVSSDKGVVFYRRMLQGAIRDVEEGRDPPLSFGPAEINLTTWSGVTMSANPDFVGEVDEAPVAPGSATIADGSPAGKWALTLETPMGEQSVVLDVSVAGGVATGTLTEGDTPVPLIDGAVRGATLVFKAKVAKPMPMTLAFDLTVTGGAVAGTFKPGMFPKGKVRGERAAA